MLEFVACVFLLAPSNLRWFLAFNFLSKLRNFDGATQGLLASLSIVEERLFAARRASLQQQQVSIEARSQELSGTPNPGTFSKVLPVQVGGVLDGQNVRFKNGHTRVETRVLKTRACRNRFWTSFQQW